MQSYSTKAPDEIWYVGMDFTAQLAPGATILSGTTRIVVLQGTDPDPQDVLSGSPRVQGTALNQTVVAGVDGVDYLLFFTVTCSNGEILESQGRLSVRAEK